MAQAVSCWPLTAEDRVRAWVCPCVICVGKSGTETGFSPSSSVFSRQFRSTVALHTHTSSGGWWPQFTHILTPSTWTTAWTIFTALHCMRQTTLYTHTIFSLNYSALTKLWAFLYYIYERMVSISSRHWLKTVLSLPPPQYEQMYSSYITAVQLGNGSRHEAILCYLWRMR
jgi:hypothetical protein